MSEDDTIKLILDPDNLPPMTPERRAMLDRLKAMPDEEIDLSDMPHHDFTIPPPKEEARLRLDGDVVAWLGECRHGADWKANFVLRHEMLRSRHRAKRDAARAAAAQAPAAQPEPEAETARA